MQKTCRFCSSAEKLLFERRKLNGHISYCISNKKKRKDILNLVILHIFLCNLLQAFCISLIAELQFLYLFCNLYIFCLLRIVCVPISAYFLRTVPFGNLFIFCVPNTVHILLSVYTLQSVLFLSSMFCIFSAFCTFGNLFIFCVPNTVHILLSV